MSILKMSKVAVLGLSEYRQQMLDQLQELGLLHVKTRERDYSSEVLDALKSKNQELDNSLKILKNLDESDQTSNLSAVEAASRVVEIDLRLKALNEEIKGLNKLHSELEPLGYFDMKAWKDVEAKGFSLYLFFVSENNLLKLQSKYQEGDWQSLTESKGKSFSLYITQNEDLSTEDGLYDLKDFDLQAIETKLSQFNKEYGQLEAELETMKSRQDEIEALSLAQNEAIMREFAVGQGQSEGDLFYLEGYLPKEKLDDLNEFAAKKGLVVQELPIDDNEMKPTAFKSKFLGKVGQMLTGIYDTPNPQSLDPSLFVLFFFSIFYGMIIADAGYGFLTILIAVFLIRGKKAKKFKFLTGLLGFSTTIFGILSVNYFGIAIAPESTVGQILYPLGLLYNDVAQSEGINSAIMISLWVGGASLAVANLFKSLALGKVSSFFMAITMISFVPFIKGLFGFELTEFEAYIGPWPMLISLFLSAVAALFETPGGFGKKIMSFALGLYSFIQLGSDVLSFLRIFALSLAGLKLAETFNMLAGMVYTSLEGIPVLGIIFAVILLIFGHAITYLLNIMSGVIHGLRLNFIESYNWMVDGGGLRYNPLKKAKSQFNI